jgi:hypothetical protein
MRNAECGARSWDTLKRGHRTPEIPHSSLRTPHFYEG